MFRGVDHVGFTVADIGRSVEFYTGLLGVEPFVRRVYEDRYTSLQVGYPGTRLDVALFEIPNSDVVLKLIQYLEPTGVPIDMETMNPGIGHLCLTTDDIADDFRRAVELGATPRSKEPVEITSGLNQGRRVAYLRDPEGITFELLEVRLL